MSTAPKPNPAPPPPAPPPRYTPIWMVILGWLISLLPAGLLLFSAYGKTTGYEPPPGTPDIGWTRDAIAGLALIEIIAAVLYLVPFSATLGAIVITAYLGGAIASHVRIGDNFAIPLVAGVLVWLGLALRDARLRNMLPIRTVSDKPAGPTGCFGCVGVLFLTLLVFVGLLLAIANALTDEFQMSRSIIIDAPPKDVFPHVNDFDKWDAWNPFSKPDPDIQVKREGPKGAAPVGKGSTYKWTSEKVGVGTMRITEVDPDRRVKIQLDFEEPYKNTGYAEFTFIDLNGKTRVTWSMLGKSPYIFKIMRSVPEVMNQTMGKAFEQGLADMKTAVESNKEAPRKGDENNDEKKKGDNNANP